MGWSLEIRVPAGTDRLVVASVRAAIEPFTTTAVALARNGCPVDTGLFRESWYSWVEVSGTKLLFGLGNDVDYAEYVHPKGDAELWVDKVADAVFANLKPRIAEAAARAIQAAILRAMNLTRGTVRVGARKGIG